MAVAIRGPLAAARRMGCGPSAGQSEGGRCARPNASPRAREKGHDDRVFGHGSVPFHTASQNCRTVPAPACQLIEL